MDHRVLGVVGASGGLGASTLAVALAVRSARSVGATVCVDTVFAGGGLDVTACLEHTQGLRWTDLQRLRGDVDGADLLRSLPAHGVARVLAARGRPVPDDVITTCLDALSSICALTVVDLGTSLRWVDHCTDVVLVSGASARQLADASAMAAGLARSGVDVRWVFRAGRREAVCAEEVAVHLDLPHAATLRDDHSVVTDADRGRAPGSRSGGAFVGAVDRVLAELDLGDLELGRGSRRLGDGVGSGGGNRGGSAGGSVGGGGASGLLDVDPGRLTA